MPLHPRHRVPLGVLAACLTLGACGGGADTADDGGTAADSAVAAAPATSDASAGAPSDAPVTEADLDVYATALAAEVELLQQAVQQRQAARTGEDTLSAMMAATEMQSVPAAAEKAGIDPDRYRALDNAFGRAVGARLQNPGMMKMTLEADTSFLAQLPAEQVEQQRAQLRKNLQDAQAAWGDSATYASVPPALVERFKERAGAQLDSLWRLRFELRARAAGLGR
jgi:hypothetical protein